MAAARPSATGVPCLLAGVEGYALVRFVTRTVRRRRENLDLGRQSAKGPVDRARQARSGRELRLW